MIVTERRTRKGAKHASGLFDSINIDYFAGGGGWSMGFERATGKAMDLAVNHDLRAIEMHRVNHPATKHVVDHVFRVDIARECADVPVSWFHGSPDCTDFSRAKGDVPIRKNIRGLAWSLVKVTRVRRPEMLSLENVREFQEWGPLLQIAWGRSRARFTWAICEVKAHKARDGKKKPKVHRRLVAGPHFKSVGGRGFRLQHRRMGQRVEPLFKPDPDRRGETFLKFVTSLRRLGYTVEWRVLNAADFGAPTHRRRLFLLARAHGQAVHWPEPTHGPGRARPWRTAAECIEKSLPCRSIFDRRLPLAPKTMRRIAMGLLRYVLESPKPYIMEVARPFIVKVNHGGEHFRGQRIDRPLATVTGSHGSGLAVVNIERSYKDFAGQAIDVPLGTITASPKGGKHALAGMALIQTGYGERVGQAPRALDLHQPLGAVVAGGRKHALVVSQFFGGMVGKPVTCPLPSVTAIDHNGLVCAALLGVGGAGYAGKPRAIDGPKGAVMPNDRTAIAAAAIVGVGGRAGQSPACGVDEPMRTTTGKADRAIAAVHMLKFRGDSAGSPVDAPMPTVTGGAGAARPAGAAHALGLAATCIARFNHGDKQWNGMDEPLGTVTSQGNKFGLAAAFFQKYYSSGGQWQTLYEPLHACRGRDCFGLVTVSMDPRDVVGAVRVGRFMMREVGATDLYATETAGAKELRAKLRLLKLARTKKRHVFRPSWLRIGRSAFPVASVSIKGEPHLATDVGLRMLVPRELARAQGFPDTYVLTGSNANQVAKIGNSVPPPMADAIVRANPGVFERRIPA